MDPQHGKGLTFSEALQQLKDGRKLQRQSWVDNGQYQWVVRQTGYPEGIPLNHNTAQATGLPEGSTQKFEPYFMMYTPWSTFVPWTPSTVDLNADDWEIYYSEGEYDRLRQEETDAILADPELVAELDEAGKDPSVYSLDELRMVVELRKLEREGFKDRDAVRFRLVNQLLRPVLDNQRQLDLADPPFPFESVSPQVALLTRTFVNVLVKLNEDLTQTKLILDATHGKIEALEKSRAAPGPASGTPSDVEQALLNHIRYFDGLRPSTETRWVMIAALLGPMLAEWRQSHADTTGDFDLNRFKVIFHGSRDEGVEKIGLMGIELVDSVTAEHVTAVEEALERLGDPEATQRLLRPGDEGYPERPQRLTDTFPLRVAAFEQDPAEGPRQIRRAAPDPEPTQVAKYFLTLPGCDEVEVTREEWVNAERHAGFRPKGDDVGQPATGGFSSTRTNSSGRIEYVPQ